VTRGTAVEEALLSARTSNYLAAVAFLPRTPLAAPSPPTGSFAAPPLPACDAAVAWVDVSTGDFFSRRLGAGGPSLAAALAMHPPVELLVPAATSQAAAAAGSLSIEFILRGLSSPAAQQPNATGSGPAAATAEGAAADAYTRFADESRLFSQVGALRYRMLREESLVGALGQATAAAEPNPASTAEFGSPSAQGRQRAAGALSKLDIAGTDGDGCAVTFVDAAGFSEESGREALARIFGSSAQDSQWLQILSPAQLSAVGGLLKYVSWTQQGVLPSLRVPVNLTDVAVGATPGSDSAADAHASLRTDAGFAPDSQLPLSAASALGFGHAARSVPRLLIDPSTRRSLEITHPMHGRRRARGSLIHAVDCCVTSIGSRLLDFRLCMPLASAPHINGRLDAVEFFAQRAPLREAVRTALAAVPDIERAMQRIALKKGTARDLMAIRDGALAAKRVAALVATGDFVEHSPTPKIGFLSRSGKVVISGTPSVDSKTAEVAFGQLTASIAGAGEHQLDPTALYRMCISRSATDFDTDLPWASGGSDLSQMAVPPLLRDASLACLFENLTGLLPVSNSSQSSEFCSGLKHFQDAIKELDAALIDSNVLRGSRAPVAVSKASQESGNVSVTQDGEDPLAEGATPGAAVSGGFSYIRSGYNADLDEARSLRNFAGEDVEVLQRSLREMTGIAALRLRHTEEQGYTAEVPARHVELMESFIRARRQERDRQNSERKDGKAKAQLTVNSASGSTTRKLRDEFNFTLAKSLKSGYRYKCEALSRLDASVYSAAARASSIEESIMRDLYGRVLSASEALAAVARAIAVVDFSTAMAENAERYKLVRPIITDAANNPHDGSFIEIRGGRHLVVERALLEGWASASSAQQWDLWGSPNFLNNAAAFATSADTITDQAASVSASAMPRLFVPNDIVLGCATVASESCGSMHRDEFDENSVNLQAKAVILRYVKCILSFLHMTMP
jgi:DNA mismatch repair ATPase MutS